MATVARLKENGSGAASRGSRKASARQTVKTVNLALQGGGAHGAFAWGVLDRLLEEERLSFEGITACSAGSMNAAVLAHGLVAGGREGAKQALEAFWKRIADAAVLSPLQPTWLDRLTGNHSLENSPAFVWFDLVTRLFSPYQLNPGNHNPLRQVLEEAVDIELLRRPEAIRLFLSATNVATGKVRIFRNEELTLDMVMASACLPLLFQAVEVEGEAYWDGGYMGNPALYPLIYHCDSRDVVVVHINPIQRPALPRTAPEILNRINEISFNSSLMREMRAIAFVTRLIDDGEIRSKRLKRMLIHSIEAEELMSRLSATSKLNADWEFLTQLRDVGRATATAWLLETWDSLNRESSVDIHERYL